MEFISKLEKTIATWYQGMPHLPKGGQQWLAKNVWWIALVGVIISAFGILMLLSALFLASTVASVYLGAAGAAVGGLGMLYALLTLAVTIVVVVLMGMAIAPLKVLKKRGWTLLFVIVLLQAVELIVEFLFSYNLFSLVWGAIMLGVGAYFLFEIRGFFGDQKAAIKVNQAKKA